MNHAGNFGLAAAAAAALLVSGAAMAGADAANTAAAASKAALVKLETSAYEAWKSKDAAFWATFLSDKFVGWGSLGRLDKASATREYTGADCEIRSYSLSDEHVSSLSQDVALITHQATVDGTCAGQKIPTGSRAAGIYIREGGRWRAVFHAHAAIVDPKQATATPAVKSDGRTVDRVRPVAQVALVDSLLSNERAVWEAWKDHDAKKLQELTADDISFINIFGTYLADKTEALKNWSGIGCDAKSVNVTDAKATMLSPTVGVLTFEATADATCFGQKVGPVRGSSVYGKQGNVWKWRFGINVPHPQ